MSSSQHFRLLKRNSFEPGAAWQIFVLFKINVISHSFILFVSIGDVLLGQMESVQDALPTLGNTAATNTINNNAARWSFSEQRRIRPGKVVLSNLLRNNWKKICRRHEMSLRVTYFWSPGGTWMSKKNKQRRTLSCIQVMFRKKGEDGRRSVFSNKANSRLPIYLHPTTARALEKLPVTTRKRKEGACVIRYL